MGFGSGRVGDPGTKCKSEQGMGASAAALPWPDDAQATESRHSITFMKIGTACSISTTGITANSK